MSDKINKAEALAKMEAFDAQPKNLVLGVVLTVLFGCFGMLYTSIKTGIICIVIWVVLIVLSMLTAGIAGLLFIPFWIVMIIYSYITLKKHNEALGITK